MGEERLELQPPQWSDFLACPICCRKFAGAVHRPVSLPCGHTLCCSCLTRLAAASCPFDGTCLHGDDDAAPAATLPVNTALLSLCGVAEEPPIVQLVAAVGHEQLRPYQSIARCLEELALLLRPLLDAGAGGLATPAGSGLSALSEPMQRQLVALLNCQAAVGAGRRRCARCCRAAAHCAVLELLDAHQSAQAQAVALWAAVRSRGCQFLGPAMQEEVLRLILSALQDGSALSRKVLVLYVVKRLEPHYPQASKTAVGHVVQLLYRASCFMVMKRPDESSLMQLKSEFREYEALRREHDAQVVQIGAEAGLRIGAEHWSALLYGDVSRRAAMAAVLQRLTRPLSLAGAVQELHLLLQRNADQDNLLRLRPQLDLLCAAPADALETDAIEVALGPLAELVAAAKDVVFALVDYVRRHSVRRAGLDLAVHKYKTSMCRDLVHRGSCPRGKVCTFAHGEDELEWHRSAHGGAGAGCAAAPLPLPTAAAPTAQFPPRQHLWSVKVPAAVPTCAANATFRLFAGMRLGAEAPQPLAGTDVVDTGRGAEIANAGTSGAKSTAILSNLRDKKAALKLELERNQRDPCHPTAVASLAQSVEDALAANRAIVNLGSEHPRRVEQAIYQPYPTGYLPWSCVERGSGNEETGAFWLPQLVSEEPDANSLAELMAYWCAGGPDRDPQFVSEDEELPAGTSFVSRFGPISRMVKTKLKPGPAITATAAQDSSTQPISAVSTSECMMSATEKPPYTSKVFSDNMTSAVAAAAAVGVALPAFVNRPTFSQLTRSAAFLQQQQQQMTAPPPISSCNTAVTTSSLQNSRSMLHVELARVNQQISLVEKDARIQCELTQLEAMEAALHEALQEEAQQEAQEEVATSSDLDVTE